MPLLRSALFNLWFYLATFLVAVATAPARLLVWLRVLPPNWGFHLMRLWADILAAGLRLICGTTWEVRGGHHLPADGAALIVSMHQSSFDTFIWFRIVPRATYVLKRELIWIPLVGGILRHLNMIVVDRGAGAGAMRSLLRGADAAKEAGRQMIIFPEGTRVAPGARATLHPGYAAIASRTGLPVIPVTTDSGHFWGRRAFRKRPGVIHIDVHPPFPAGLPRAELAARLEALFAAAGDA